MTKDIKSAPARTKIYIRLLTSKHGTDVATMEQAVRDAEADGTLVRRAEGYTRHNSYSLNKLALTYGFTFRTDVNPKTGVKEYEGATRYFFDSAKNNPKLAAKALKAKEAKVSSKVRLPRVEGVKAPASDPGADMPAIAAKASKASRKARASVASE
jgi:hypothetical protein